MKIDVNSKEMSWILTKFLMDSLEFLPEDEANGIPKKTWVNLWQQKELSKARIKEWMPKDDY